MGSRFVDIKQPLRDKMPFIRYLANISLSFLYRMILGIRASELNSGARVYSRKALERVDLTHTSNDFLFSFEMIAQIVYIRMKIGEVSVRCYYDQAHSSISLKRSVVYAVETFGTLGQFVLARLGFRTKLFHK